MNDPIFKSSNARALPERGGMLMFRFDRRIISRFESSIKKSAMDGFILKMLKSSVFKMTSFALLIGSVIALVLLFDSRLKPALIQQFSNDCRK